MSQDLHLGLAKKWQDAVDNFRVTHGIGWNEFVEFHPFASDKPEGVSMDEMKDSKGRQLQPVMVWGPGGEEFCNTELYRKMDDVVRSLFDFWLE